MAVAKWGIYLLIGGMPHLNSDKRVILEIRDDSTHR